MVASLVRAKGARGPDQGPRGQPKGDLNRQLVRCQGPVQEVFLFCLFLVSSHHQVAPVIKDEVFKFFNKKGSY